VGPSGCDRRGPGVGPGNGCGSTGGHGSNSSCGSCSSGVGGARAGIQRRQGRSACSRVKANALQSECLSSSTAAIVHWSLTRAGKVRKATQDSILQLARQTKQASRGLPSQTRHPATSCTWGHHASAFAVWQRHMACRTPNRVTSLRGSTGQQSTDGPQPAGSQPESAPTLHRLCTGRASGHCAAVPGFVS
jgi:hypothetical protein